MPRERSPHPATPAPTPAPGPKVGRTAPCESLARLLARARLSPPPFAPPLPQPPLAQAGAVCTLAVRRPRTNSAPLVPSFCTCATPRGTPLVQEPRTDTAHCCVHPLHTHCAHARRRAAPPMGSTLHAHPRANALWAQMPPLPCTPCTPCTPALPVCTPTPPSQKPRARPPPISASPPPNFPGCSSPICTPPRLHTPHLHDPICTPPPPFAHTRTPPPDLGRRGWGARGAAAGTRIAPPPTAHPCACAAPQSARPPAAASRDGGGAHVGWGGGVVLWGGGGQRCNAWGLWVPGGSYRGTGGLWVQFIGWGCNAWGGGGRGAMMGVHGCRGGPMGVGGRGGCG